MPYRPQYLRYYYYHDEILAELRAKATTRAEDILALVPDYWAHYIEQSESDDPVLDPARSRGGIFELELALDAMDSFYNDLGRILPVNTPNVGGALHGFPEDLVVEVFATVDRNGVHPEAMAPLPRHLRGLFEMLGEYQWLTAEAAWSGTRLDAIRALASHPWLLSLHKAEAVYDEMAARSPRVPARPIAGVSQGGTLLLGVDGGATKTVALVADEHGSVLGAGRSGSSDIKAAPEPGAAVDRVADAVREAAAMAGVRAADVDACAFCLCGADWPEDDAYYAATLEERLALASAPVVKNDAFASLRAGTPDGVGVALVMGTGAAIAACGPTGATWFSGDRMERSGAVELGQRVYGLLVRRAYGSGTEPPFERAALDAFAVDDVEALVHEITRLGGRGRSGLGRLAAVLLDAADEGDPTARAIVDEHGQLLSGYVRAAAARVGLPQRGAKVVLSGGLMRHPSPELIGQLGAGLPGFAVTTATVEPVYGAVLLAADGSGVSPDIERLRDSGPEASFFHTL